jgi:hypothetical protein
MQSGRHKSVESNALYIEPTMNALAHRSKVLQYDPTRDGVQENGEVVVVDVDTSATRDPTELSPAKKKRKKKRSKHKKQANVPPFHFMNPMMQHFNYQAMMQGMSHGYGMNNAFSTHGGMIQQQQQQQFYPPYMGNHGVFGGMGPSAFGMNQGFGGNGNFGMMPQGFGMPLPPAMMPPTMAGAMGTTADSDSSTSSSSSSSSDDSD